MYRINPLNMMFKNVFQMYQKQESLDQEEYLLQAELLKRKTGKK